MPQADFIIAPSILSADFANLQSEIRKIKSGGADWVHVDVMDGHFVPNLTIGPPVVKALRQVTDLPLDVHLMIEKPEDSFEDYIKAGADYLTIHVEATHSAKELLQKIRSQGVKPGITLRPATPVSEIFPLLEFVDLVLIMTVNPGFGGQSFMRDQVQKISQVKTELKRIGHAALIEVDGGVTAETAKELREADVLVAGSYIFANKENLSVDESILKLKGAKHD